SAPQRRDDGDAVHLHPVVRAAQRVHEARGVRLPGAEVEVELVAALAARRSRDARSRQRHHAAERCELQQPPPGLSRARSAMKAGSQLLPPSAECAISKWCEFGLMSDHVPRTSSERPPTVSCPYSSPRPSLNSPIMPGVMVPSALPT